MHKARSRVYFIYVLALHLALIASLVNSGAAGRIAYMAGLSRGEPHDKPLYQRMLRLHRRVDGNVPRGAVLFLGDSMTQGLCVSAITGGGVNFGISGDTTTSLLERLPSYASVRHAAAVVQNIGFNDLRRRSNGEILGNIQRALEQIPQGTPVLFSGVFPVDQRVRGEGVNERIRVLNERVQALCGSLDNCSFVETNRRLTDATGNLRSNYHIGDGLHLSPEGYEVWIQDLRLGLERLEPAKQRP